MLLFPVVLRLGSSTEAALSTASQVLPIARILAQATWYVLVRQVYSCIMRVRAAAAAAAG